MKRQSVVIAFVLITTCASLAFGQSQSATALEDQYKTCAKHYIPVDKCTPEIYRQLKDKDNTPLDPNVALALRAVKEYQKKLNNPASLQVHVAYVTDSGNVCLEVGGQNAMGGQTVSRIEYANGKWKDEGGFGGQAMMGTYGPGGVDRWDGHCVQGWHRKFLPGTDVTEKVNRELSEDPDLNTKIQTGVPKGPASPTDETAIGTVNVTSNPDGGDVYADGQFVGNSPAVLKLKPGTHTVTVKLSGHQDWSREITVASGSKVRLIATLE
jgi:hypothetical protein